MLTPGAAGQEGIIHPAGTHPSGMRPALVPTAGSADAECPQIGEQYIVRTYRFFSSIFEPTCVRMLKRRIARFR